LLEAGYIIKIIACLLSVLACWSERKEAKGEGVDVLSFTLA